MGAGRPMKFKTVEELQQKIDGYFASCFTDVILGIDKEGNPITENKQTRPFTITGLALYLDTTRETLLDYQDKEKFSDTIKKAKMKCENFAEEQLFLSRNIAGVIFNMKNNYGWKDKTEVDQTVNANVNHDFTGLSDEDLERIIKGGQK